MKFMQIGTDNDEWNKAMYHQKCVCGHELYIHAFTMGKYDENSAELRVSQCTFCDYDEENEKFLCDGFVKDMNKCQ